MTTFVRVFITTAVFIITCEYVQSLSNGSHETRENAILMGSSTKLKKKIPDSYSNKKRFDPKTGSPRIMYDLDYTLEGSVDFQYIADSFLKKYANLMKIGGANDLKPFMVKHTPAGATVRYRQNYVGIEVYNSDVAVSVNNKNTVTFVVSDYKPDIQPINTYILVSRESALNTALREMNISYDDISAVEAKIVIFTEKDYNKSSRIAWLIKVIAMKEKLISYEFIYDAYSGANLQIKNLLSDKVGSVGLSKGFQRALVVKAENGMALNPEINNVQVANKPYLGPSLEDYLTGNYRNKRTYMRGAKKGDGKRNRPMILEVFVAVALYVYSLVSNHREVVDGKGGVFDPNPLATAKAKYYDPGFANYFGITTPQLAAQIKNVTLRDITFDGFYYKLEGPCK